MEELERFFEKHFTSSRTPEGFVKVQFCKAMGVGLNEDIALKHLYQSCLDLADEGDWLYQCFIDWVESDSDL